MKVRSVEPVAAEFVTMDDGVVYRRSASGEVWQELMGMSWEDISHRADAQEAAYQAFKAQKP